jgi:hypothetical protein
MSDAGAVTGTITRKLRKKSKKRAAGANEPKVAVSFLIMSKKRPKPKPGVKARDWNDDWPEFYEQLKGLARRYQLTIKKTRTPVG